MERTSTPWEWIVNCNLQFVRYKHAIYTREDEVSEVVLDLERDEDQQPLRNYGLE